MRSYQVRFGKKEEDCAQISALDLYKLIDHVVGPTHTKKLVPLTDSKSAFADVKMIDNQILMELKKNICCDLKLVWDLPKDSRNKAVKRLYLNYHPDKAEPEEAEIYDDAFKFLLKQIENLDAGLELDNPSAEVHYPQLYSNFHGTTSIGHGMKLLEICTEEDGRKYGQTKINPVTFSQHPNSQFV